MVRLKTYFLLIKSICLPYGVPPQIKWRFSFLAIPVKTIISSPFMILVSVPLCLLEIPWIINWIKAWFLHNGEHHFSLLMKIDCFLVFTKGLKKSLKIHYWLKKNIIWIFGIIKIKIFSQDKKSLSKEIRKRMTYTYIILIKLNFSVYPMIRFP